jgi:SAM-dependent methyltransferase
MRLYDSTSTVGRFNAWFFDRFDSFIDWSLRRLKRKVFTNLPQTVVEIGPGVGANFRYYRPGMTVIAIEPNPAMHQRLQANAREAGIRLELEDTFAEDTGLPTGSAAAVVTSLVLCSVTDPEAAIAEAHRILEPGGRLIVVEHVRGQGPVLRTIQRLVRRPWRWVFDGCELGRDTLATVQEAGFASVEMVERTVITAFVPVNSFVYGHATK